jgi:hypothetical protein
MARKSSPEIFVLSGRDLKDTEGNDIQLYEPPLNREPAPTKSLFGPVTLQYARRG